MATAIEFTAREKLAEIEREIAWRHRVYARAIKAGRMPAKDAQRRIQIMNAIAEDYRRAITAAPDLFQRSALL